MDLPGSTSLAGATGVHCAGVERHEHGEERSGPVGPLDALKVPRFAGVRTFARLPTIEQVPRADVAVLGVPFDSAATFRVGARFGPAAIREASLLLRPFNESQNVAPFELAQVVDAGDAPANPIEVESAHAEIERAARELQGAGAAVVGLGGDHSVALPLLRAAAERFGPLGLLQFDAHTDTWDSYFGYKLSHGTIFRRAVEEGILDASRSLQIGLRGSVYSGEDSAENAALGFRVVRAEQMDELGIAGALDVMRETLRGPLYVSVDIDVLDPAFAPGTGTPEAGGLTSRELLALVRGLRTVEGVEIASADVVEVSPPYDAGGATAIAGSNVAYELVCLLAQAADRRRREGGNHGEGAPG